MGWLVLNEKERRDLVKLLMEHLDYGWVEAVDRYKVFADLSPSPALEGLYRRLAGYDYKKEGLRPGGV